MSNFTVLYDACVLYPAPLRDLLMYLAMTGLYRAKWTDAIHDEWLRNVLKNRPDLKLEQLQRTRRLMDENVLDCLITGYEPLMTGLTLPDPNDHHVLAAAIKAGAAVIVTFNLKHFPDAALDPYGLEAQHPDTFLAYQLDLAPNIVRTAVKRQRTSLKNPPKSVEEYLSTLEAQGLPRTVAELRRFPELI